MADASPDAPRFAAASLAAVERLTPTHVPAVDGASQDGASHAASTSTQVGWTSLLLSLREGEGDGTPFQIAATPDQTLVLSLSGPFEIESFSDGRWRRAVRTAGSVCLAPSDGADRVRRWARDRRSIRTAHGYIPRAFFDDARERLRRTGTRGPSEPHDALVLRDPVVAQSVLALAQAMRAGAPDLYAQSAAQFLATHLLVWHGQRRPGPARGRRPEVLTDQRLARVVEYMTAHFQEPLALARLAVEAGISKFHFVRLFRAATGETPHGFLVRLRMEWASQSLRDSELTIAEVAAASGYTSTSQFRAAFRSYTGRAPLAFRTNARR